MAMCSAWNCWNSSLLSHCKMYVLWAVPPCLKEFRDDFSLPSAVVGPCDLDPLARDVSDFSSDGIVLSPNPMVLAGFRMATGRDPYMIENNQSEILSKAVNEAEGRSITRVFAFVLLELRLKWLTANGIRG
jgi:hypothetical protein